MFENIVAKFKQHPVMFMNALFTFFCAINPLSSGAKTIWLLSWFAVPLALPTRVAFPCIMYMSLYMQLVNVIELFTILVCLSFTIILIKQIIYLNKNKLLNKYSKILFYYLLLLVIPLFYSIFINNKLSVQFIYYLNMINILLLIYLNKNLLNKQLILMYSYGIIVSSSLSILLYFAGLHYFPFYGGARFTAYLPLCNTLGAVCVLCIALIYMLIANNKIRLRQGVALISLLSLIGMITFSKNFFITYVIVMLVILFNTFKGSKHKKRLIVFSLMTMLLLSPVVLIYLIKMFDRFFVEHNYYANIIDTLTTGRLDKWIIYLTPFVSSIPSILFGVGICYKYPTMYSSHSIYVGYLSRMGIWGFILLSCFVYLIIRNQIKHKAKFKYLPLIILAIICCAEDISFNTFYFIPFILACCTCLDRRANITVG